MSDILCPPLPYSQFTALTVQTRQKVGSIYLSLRRGYYEDKTQPFVWIDQINNLCNKKLKHVGAALVEAAVELSLNHETQGRVKLLAYGCAHLFYMKRGFFADQTELVYPDCLTITRFLKQFFSPDEQQQQALEQQPLMHRAKTILALEHQKKMDEIDIHYIKKHWYWDENYPTKTRKDHSQLVSKVKNIPPSSRSYSFPPMTMYLPQQSIEVWKKLINISVENQQERPTLFFQLREITLHQS